MFDINIDRAEVLLGNTSQYSIRLIGYQVFISILRYILGIDTKVIGIESNEHKKFKISERIRQNESLVTGIHSVME